MIRSLRRSGFWPLLVLLVAFVGLARAEEGDEGDSEAKTRRLPVLLLGASRSTFAVGDLEAADPKAFWSPRLGLTYTAPRDVVTAFEVGLWANLCGGEWKDEGDGLKRLPALVAPPAYTHQLKLLYLSVPAMVRLTAPARPLTPYAKLGVAASYLLRAREETITTATGRTHRGERSVLARMNRFHVDALAALGVRTNLKRLPLVFETLYLYGLTDVLKENRVESRPDLKNRSLQFFVGIGLRRERA